MADIIKPLDILLGVGEVLGVTISQEAIDEIRRANAPEENSIAFNNMQTGTFMRRTSDTQDPRPVTHEKALNEIMIMGSLEGWEVDVQAHQITVYKIRGLAHRS